MIHSFVPPCQSLGLLAHSTATWLQRNKYLRWKSTFHHLHGWFRLVFKLPQDLGTQIDKHIGMQTCEQNELPQWWMASISSCSKDNLDKQPHHQNYKDALWYSTLPCCHSLPCGSCLNHKRKQFPPSYSLCYSATLPYTATSQGRAHQYEVLSPVFGAPTSRLSMPCANKPSKNPTKFHFLKTKDTQKRPEHFYLRQVEKATPFSSLPSTTPWQEVIV